MTQLTEKTMEAGLVPAVFFLVAVAYAVASAVQNVVRELRYT